MGIYAETFDEVINTQNKLQSEIFEELLKFQAQIKSKTT